ncbi:MAG: hypothetical protein AABX51_02495 [Nanoarchaeota archaeon]
MKGRLFGLDIKLSPHFSGENFPHGIELNGIDFGTDFFKYEQGKQYYDRLLQVLFKEAEGKPIFVETSPTKESDSLGLAILKARTSELYKKQREGADFLAQILGEHFEFEYGWINDLERFHLGKLDEKDDPEKRMLANLAAAKGIELYLFTRLEYENGSINFHLENGRTKGAPHSQIGLVWPYSSTLWDVPEKFRDLFLGNPVEETIMDSKAFMHFLEEHYNAPPINYLPPGIVFGFGITTRTELVDFLKESPSDLIVRKRGGSYCGTGVEILEKGRLISELRRTTPKPISNAKLQALYYVLSQTMINVELEEYLSVYEEFIPSIKIKHPETGKKHDACARTVVYLPDNGIPEVLGSQWRLAPKPLGYQGSLEESLRANLSRGATAIPMDPKHEYIISSHASLMTRCFEAQAKALKREVEDYREETKDLDQKNLGNLTDHRIVNLLLNFGMTSSNAIADGLIQEDLSPEATREILQITREANKPKIYLGR